MNLKRGIIALLATFSTVSFAQVGNSSLFKNNISVGLETQSWHYEEFRKSGATFMKDYGMLYGVAGQLEFITANDWQMKISGKYLGGDTKYEGGLQDGHGSYTPYNTKSINRIFELNGVVGLPIQMGQSNHYFIPSAGMALRYLHNPELPEDKYDYTRIAVYYTLPISANLKGRITNSISYSAGAQYDFLLGAATTSRMSGGDIVNPQNEGYGFKLNAGLQLDLKNKGALSLNTYYRFWDFEDSETVYATSSNGKVYGFTEPKNKTNSFGINASWQFF